MEGDGAALRYASKVASFDIIKVLVNEISKKIKRTGSAISLKEFINHQDKRGLTSLHYSCQKKCGKTTKYLLKHGGGEPYGISEHSLFRVHHPVPIGLILQEIVTAFTQLSLKMYLLGSRANDSNIIYY